MSNSDFEPLSRSTIGFDCMFDRRTNSSRLFEGRGDNQPYDILRSDENYRISLAVAGFVPEKIPGTAQQNAESMKPRRIPIAARGVGAKNKQGEGIRAVS